MKKIVIFGGGSGLSQLLKGIKLFPLDITAVVSVVDNGGSTGLLRKEFNFPAVADITKVMLSMSSADEDVIKLMNYRFTKSKTIGIHSVKNLLLIALLDMKGSFAKAMPVLESLFDVKGNILPLTEDNVELIGITKEGKEIFGEAQVTKCIDKIKDVKYNKDIVVNPKVLKAVNEADLIIFSSGSLFTSIAPHLLDKTLVEAINKSKADRMYICNLFTQPGETDGFTVRDHVDYLERYLGKGKLNVVIANNKIISSKLARKYATEQQKDPVVLDMNELEHIHVIQDKLAVIENGVYRHDALKTGYLIFSYLMERRK